MSVTWGIKCEIYNGLFRFFYYPQRLSIYLIEPRLKYYALYYFILIFLFNEISQRQLLITRVESKSVTLGERMAYILIQNRISSFLKIIPKTVENGHNSPDNELHKKTFKPNSKLAFEVVKIWNYEISKFT